MTDNDIIIAHNHCMDNQAEVLTSELCGCFSCLRTFPPVEIKDWITGKNEESLMAICPYCGIDSVIGSESGYPVTHEFLEKMQKYWF